MYGRLKCHKTDLSRGVDKCFRLQRAVSKYGLQNFLVYVLEVCSAEDLDEREIYWISEYRTSDWNYGYNVTLGGNNGIRHTEGTKRRLSELKKGTHLSDDHKRKISIGNKGKFVSDETRI